MNICKNTYLSNQNVLFIQSLYLCFNYVVTIASYQSILFSGKYTDGPTNPSNCTDQGLYIGYDSISVLSQSVSLLQVYLLLELSSSSLLAGTGGNRRRPAATSPLVFSVVRLALNKAVCTYHL